MDTTNPILTEDLKTDVKSVEKKISDLIVSCMYSGDKLPTEKEMMKMFGIGRAALRNILVAYETSGFIRSIRGSGRYAMKPDFGDGFIETWAMLIRANPYMILELLEIRGLLEINTLPVAVERITIKQLQAMGDLVEIMRQKALQNIDSTAEDRLFHRILYESTGNQLLEQLLIAFEKLFASCEIDFRHSDVILVAEQHAEILDAVSKRQLPLVIKLMKQQFVEVRARMIESLAKYQKMQNTFSESSFVSEPRIGPQKKASKK